MFVSIEVPIDDRNIKAVPPQFVITVIRFTCTIAYLSPCYDYDYGLNANAHRYIGKIHYLTGSSLRLIISLHNPNKKFKKKNRFV